jgi:type I restriction enzyme S subunit
MKKYKINEICDVICGGTPSTAIDKYWNGDIVWLTPKDLSINKNKYINHSEQMITMDGLNHSSTKIVPIGSVLLSSRAPIGYMGISNVKLCTNQGFKALVCNSNLVNNEFLYYLLLNKVEELKNISTGSTFLELSTTTLKQYEVSLPELENQQHIVNNNHCQYTLVISVNQIPNFCIQFFIFFK